MANLMGYGMALEGEFGGPIPPGKPFDCGARQRGQRAACLGNIGEAQCGVGIIGLGDINLI